MFIICVVFVLCLLAVWYWCCCLFVPKFSKKVERVMENITEKQEEEEHKQEENEDE